MRLTDEQIATELRALRPTPREDFAAELDYRAEHGFPRLEKDLPADRESPRRSFALRAGAPISGGPLRWNRLLPALGAFAAVVVVIGIAVSLNGGNGTPDTGDLEAISGDQSQPGGAGAAAEQG